LALAAQQAQTQGITQQAISQMGQGGIKGGSKGAALNALSPQMSGGGNEPQRLSDGPGYGGGMASARPDPSYDSIY
jgi:hypothetical protein